MAKNYYDITLALAGICQSLRLVQQLAHEGQCENDALQTSLKSICVIDAPSTLSVFGSDVSVLKLGLETLQSILGGNNAPATNELTRYLIGLQVLERKLSANPSALNELSSRLSQLERQLVHFDINSETIYNAFSSIYVDIISVLGPRIQVVGVPQHLQVPIIQAKVRASLLAGIRSTVLWHQIGGRRLQFMFSRNRLLQQAKAILTHS